MGKCAACKNLKILKNTTIQQDLSDILNIT